MNSEKQKLAMLSTISFLSITCKDILIWVLPSLDIFLCGFSLAKLYQVAGMCISMHLKILQIKLLTEEKYISFGKTLGKTLTLLT